MVFILSSLVFPYVIRADGMFDAEEIRIRYEDNLERQLDRALLSVMPSNTFDVMVNVKLGIHNRKNQTEQIIQKKTSEKSGPKFTKTAPGFDPTLVESPQADEDTDLKESFGYEKEIVVKKVFVVLILHKFLSDDKKELAKGIINDKVNSVYGNLANVVVRESEFVTLHTPTFTSQVKNFFYFHASTLLYYLLGLFAMVLLFSLVKMLRPKKWSKENKKSIREAADQKAALQENAEEGKKEKIRKDIDSCLLMIVDAVQKDASILKDLLIDLPESEAAVFFSVVESSSLRGPVGELIGELVISGGEIVSEEEVGEILRNIAAKLEHYVRLRHIAQEIPFWYLKSIDMRELLRNVGENSIENLAVILQYLPVKRTKEFLSFLSADIKASLLEKMTVPAFLKSLAPLEKDIDKKLNAYVQTAKMQKKGKNENQLFTQLLDYDASLESTMKALKTRGVLKEDKRIKKYFSTFDDFMREDVSVISSCMQELDNHNFAVLLKGMDKENQSKLLAGSPSLRRNILRDEMLVLGNTEIDKTAAIHEIMRIYRNTMKG